MSKSHAGPATKKLMGELYPDRGGHWRWRILSANHKPVAVSGESFASTRNAWRALRGFRDTLVEIGINFRLRDRRP